MFYQLVGIANASFYDSQIRSSNQSSLEPTYDKTQVDIRLFNILYCTSKRKTPPTARVCRCGGELDILGDHRAACATAGVLVRRAVPVERVVAQICREAGGRVATDVFLRELNLASLMPDAWRSLPTASHPSTVRKWPSTSRWCVQSSVTDAPAPALTRSLACPSPKPRSAKVALTQSSGSKDDASL